MISLDHIRMEFSAKPVLDDVSFLINRKERIALVGKNGAGKTTLLRLIAGEYEPTSGRIARETDMTIGYLPQVMLFHDDRTLREEVMTECTKGQSTKDKGDEARFIAEMDGRLSVLDSSARILTDLVRSSPADGECVSNWRRYYSGILIYCCWMSLPTTWILSLFNGWKISLRPVRPRYCWLVTTRLLSTMYVPAQ